MSTFTPPNIAEVPPVPVAESQYAPSVWTVNPLGSRLAAFMASRPAGVSVFKMSDGTYQMNRNVPGITGVKVQEPYPACPEKPSDASGGIGVVNDALGWSYFAETATEIPLEQPTVSIVYLGGHSYTVSSAEAAALTAAGFGAYIT